MSLHSLLPETAEVYSTTVGALGSPVKREPIIEDPILKSAQLNASSPGSVRSYTLKTVHLGAAFCFIFTAFNVAQSYITILYPDVGSLALGVIYGFFALGSLVAPRLGQRMGIKWAMCAASVCFVAFIGSINTGEDELVLLAAAVVGLGSGLLWINQGVWLSKLGANTGGALTGYFTGLFFTICNSNGIVGNILAIILLEAGLSMNLMIWGMFVAGAIGFLLMIFIDPMHSTVVATLPEQTLTFTEQVRAVWEVAKLKKSLVLMPSIWMQGCNLAFMFGRLPDMLPDGAGKVAVAKVFLCYGVTQCIFSYLNGIIYDKFGWKPLVNSFLATGLFASFILATMVPSDYTLYVRAGDIIEPYLLIGALLGHLDTTLNTLINLACSKAYQPGSQTGAAFGFYRVGFCAAMTVMNIVAEPFAVGWIVAWDACWIVTAGVLYRRHADELQGIKMTPVSMAGPDAEAGVALTPSSEQAFT
ncbi:hypothetical protein HDU89_005021 [Geranomyces variabilis]|nr:hypothetical protein HDU89_005021 [Geranomyces variabilis]